MAERVNVVAVDMGDGPGAAEQQIAAHKRDAQRVARLQWPFEGHVAGPRARGGAHRHEALILEGGAEHRAEIRLETAHHQRRGDRPQHRRHFTAETADRGRTDELRIRGPIGKRAVPVQRAAESGHQAVARQRKLDIHARRRRTRRCQGRFFGHLVDRRDAGDRFLREAAEGVGDGADEAAVDVDRAAAHSGDDAGLGERSAFEPRQNHVPARAHDVFDDADDVGAEFFDAGAGENGVANAHHAGPDLGDRHERCGRVHPVADRRQQAQNQQDDGSARRHGVHSVIEEKCLLVKEKWARSLTGI